jgi:hypothetical protein
MKAITLFFPNLALLVTSASAIADQPVHLFILSGQSNMAGMNPNL